MTQMYKVKGSKDYLCDPITKEIKTYTRGEALKKARMFGAKIEKSHIIDHEEELNNAINNTVEGFFYCTTQDELEEGEEMQLWEPFETCGSSEIEDLQSNLEDTIKYFIKGNKEIIEAYLKTV